MPSPAVTELLQEHVVAAMIKQARLREVVGDVAQGWSADLPTRRLTLGRRSFEIELIATEPPGSGAVTAAVLAVGARDFDAYYLAPHGENVLVLGIRDARQLVGPPSGATLASTFTNLLEAAPPLDHRRAFAHYLARPLPAVPAEIVDGRVVLTVADGVVRVAFDDDGRVSELRAE